MRTASWTTAALVAFAANSILCRLALRDGAADPASFSTIRLAAGAIALVAVTRLTGARPARTNVGWMPAALLALYAVPFAFAYVRLTTGTGALILFGAVQITMLVAALAAGEKGGAMQWIGVAIALVGLAVLTRPGLTAPPLRDAALMAVAGAAWGLYSLRGRGAADPVAQTTANFIRATPLVLAVSVLMAPRIHLEARGVWLAVGSGALASGLGYVAWYAALASLTRLRAAVVQLTVPVLTALGGVLFLDENVSARLLAATALILGGVALTVRAEKVPTARA